MDMNRLLYIVSIFFFLHAEVYAAGFMPLKMDGIHDPAGPGIDKLQDPNTALPSLPPLKNGQPNWVKAIEDGTIEPRMGLTGDEVMKHINLDIIMKNTVSMPYVKFSHYIHTKWLTCSNCHAQIFKPQKGGNLITMAGILEGEYCGVCHGKVAFSPLECPRCHMVEDNNPGLR